MRLFVDRATAARGDFAIDRSNAAAVTEICRRLDGMPLAIELAAARVVAMSPSDIATRLDERFRLLTGGRRTAVERHQTLRATVDWSYSMLDERERGVFDRLGVFVGGFDATAAEAVATGDGIESWDVLDALVDLVGKSMVVAEETAGGGTRYQLLETLRHYARERLDEHDDADAWRRRHAEHFAMFAESIGPLLTGPDELAARRTIETELDNTRAAVTWGLDRDDEGDSEFAVRIVAALALEGANNRAGIGAWAIRALEHADRSSPGRRCAIYALAAMAIFYTGDQVEAERLASEALRDGLAADCSCPTLPYIALANTTAARHDVEGNHRAIDEGLAALDAIGADPWNRCVLLASAATYDAMAGNLDRARDSVTPVLPEARRTRNPTVLVVTLFAYGWSLWESDPEAALAALDESAELTRSGASEAAFGPALMEAARLRMRRGERDAAFANLREAVMHCHTVADYPELSGVLSTASTILVEAGEFAHSAVLAGFCLEGPVAHFSMPFGGCRGRTGLEARRLCGPSSEMRVSVLHSHVMQQ